MATCRYCGRKIDWAVTDGGRKVPLDGSGENHFRTCPGWREAKAKEWKREKERMEWQKAALDARQGRLF